MSVHRTAAEGFARGAQTYVRGRPEFPPAVRDWLLKDLQLHAGKVALDVGAGTGKFTKHLVATGAQTLALEPVEPMLDQLKRAVPGATACLGSAAGIALADESVDAVVCAQSFHWFADVEALAEMRRVLKPGGKLGLVWNVRDQSVDWVERIARLVAEYEGDAPRYDNGTWRGLFPAEGFTELVERRVPHGHTGSVENVIIDRVCSISFIAALDADERQRVVARLREIIASTPALAGRDEVTFPYFTVMYHCEKR